MITDHHLGWKGIWKPYKFEIPFLYFSRSISIFLFTWNDYYVRLNHWSLFLESIHIQPDHFLEGKSKQNGRNEFGFYYYLFLVFSMRIFLLFLVVKLYGLFYILLLLRCTCWNRGTWEKVKQYESNFKIPRVLVKFLRFYHC